MEAVLDTNVAVSAAISPKGPPAEIIRAWRASLFVWVTSPPLLEELSRTMRSRRLRRYLALTEEELDEFLSIIEEDARLVVPVREVSVITSDPSDNRILEAAVTAGASYIVSGDADLLQVASYEDIPIVSPARFASILKENAADEL